MCRSRRRRWAAPAACVLVLLGSLLSCAVVEGSAVAASVQAAASVAAAAKQGPAAAAAAARAAAQAASLRHCIARAELLARDAAKMPQAATGGKPIPAASGSIQAAVETACTVAGAATFCASKPAEDKYYANPASGCQCFYRCGCNGCPAAYKCSDGLLFNNAAQYCDWPENVPAAQNCGSTTGGGGGGGTSPRPAPSPSISRPSPSPPPSPPLPPRLPVYAGYSQAWSEPWCERAADCAIAKMPSYVRNVYISFMRPDNSYQGELAQPGLVAASGVEFWMEGTTMRRAIALLKQRNPNTKADNYCTRPPETPSVQCGSDREFISVIRRLRAALPRPQYTPTAAVWSVGAYGQGAWRDAQPIAPRTGMAVNPLKTVGHLLDAINIMSYDAGPDFRPTQAFNAYRSLYSGRILLGVEVPPEAWGGHETSAAEVRGLAQYVKQRPQGGAGMFLWSLQKSGTPSAQDISGVVCRNLALGNCSQLLPGPFESGR
ncbi:hypothetical protein ABPG75_002512 [Micractinium tetrahymenae]